MVVNNNGYIEPNPESNPTGWGFTYFGGTPEASKADDIAAQIPAPPETGEAGKCFPLAMASIGNRLQIVKLKGSEGTVRRLIGMGLAPGMEVEIISSTGGSVIVAQGDNRIGLGAGMAQKILCTVNS
jgi:ferrous iron transport protein A